MNEVTRIGRPEVPSTSVSIANPAAATTSPPAITNAGRARFAIAGVSIEPTMKVMPNGIVQRPASSGESPSTSCKYWPMKTKMPNATSVPSV
jgi:hypothetical protein